MRSHQSLHWRIELHSVWPALATIELRTERFFGMINDQSLLSDPNENTERHEVVSET